MKSCTFSASWSSTLSLQSSDPNSTSEASLDDERNFSSWSDILVGLFKISKLNHVGSKLSVQWLQSLGFFACSHANEQRKKINKKNSFFLSSLSQCRTHWKSSSSLLCHEQHIVQKSWTLYIITRKRMCFLNVRHRKKRALNQPSFTHTNRNLFLTC